MSDQWQYQLRVYLNDKMAELARHSPSDIALRPLTEILERHDAALVCLFDSFAAYVAEAEREGIEHYPLYKWTKATIDDPDKRGKHVRSFTLHVADHEVYAKAVADALEADLQPLVGGALVTRMSKHDSNPANNPQMPAEYRS